MPYFSCFFNWTLFSRNIATSQDEEEVSLFFIYAEGFKIINQSFINRYLCYPGNARACLCSLLPVSPHILWNRFSSSSSFLFASRVPKAECSSYHYFLLFSFVLTLDMLIQIIRSRHSSTSRIQASQFSRK